MQNLFFGKSPVHILKKIIVSKIPHGYLPVAHGQYREFSETATILDTMLNFSKRTECTRQILKE